MTEHIETDHIIEQAVTDLLAIAEPAEHHTAIVTGANHGIGAATALALAKAGCSVLCTYLRVVDEADPGVPPAYRVNRVATGDAVLAEIVGTGGIAVAAEADLTD